MNDPYRELRTSAWSELAGIGRRRLESHTHGDLPRWREALDGLPAGSGYHRLDGDMPVLGEAAADQRQLRGLLMRFHPWRKGPLQLGGVTIDTEWRSDWKWNRLRPHIDLAGKEILDIGCGNGYFGLRMLGAGARLVVGIDPTLVFVMQWLAMQKLCPGLDNYVLPLGIEDLPVETGRFDCVFSMGVLYHRRDPVEHLERLKMLTRPGGKIVLETLVLEGERGEVLVPEGRYARMRNVHAVPSLPVLNAWLTQAGLANPSLLDVSRTTADEQRSTGWMTFESLSECLDQNDPALTVEGYPAPVRAALLVGVD